MVVGFILVCYEAGKGIEVLKGAKGIKGVKRATPVLGRWDIVVEAEAKDTKALGDVALKVNAVPGIRATETLVGI